MIHLILHDHATGANHKVRTEREHAEALATLPTSASRFTTTIVRVDDGGVWTATVRTGPGESHIAGDAGEWRLPGAAPAATLHQSAVEQAVERLHPVAHWRLVGDGAAEAAERIYGVRETAGAALGPGEVAFVDTADGDAVGRELGPSVHLVRAIDGVRSLRIEPGDPGTGSCFLRERLGDDIDRLVVLTADCAVPERVAWSLWPRHVHMRMGDGVDPRVPLIGERPVVIHDVAHDDLSPLLRLARGCRYDPHLFLGPGDADAFGRVVPFGWGSVTVTFPAAPVEPLPALALALAGDEAPVWHDLAALLARHAPWLVPVFAEPVLGPARMTRPWIHALQQAVGGTYRLEESDLVRRRLGVREGELVMRFLPDRGFDEIGLRLYARRAGASTQIAVLRTYP